jgi:hydroxymethylbilane synthase
MTEVALAAAFPDLEIERVIIKTTGDRRTDVALNEVAKVEGIWDKGVFIKELEVALEVGEIDVAVHSLKDLPTVLEEPFQLRSVLERAPVADVWIGKIPWSEVKKGSRVGTSSVRRARQIQFLKAGVKLVDLRGNVPTRMGKAAKDADYDGIILAEAGLTRLGYQTEGMFEIDRHPVFVECLAERNFFPAAGQGAVGLEIRRGDDEVGKIIDVLNHDDTWNRVTAEREFLRLLDAGCSTPIGVWSKLTGEHLEMGARVFPEKPGSPRKAKASGVVPLEVAQQLFDNLK